MRWIFATIFLILGTGRSQELSEYLQTLKEKIDPFVSVEEVQNAVKNKCEKNGGVEAYDKLEASVRELEEFLYANFNITRIKEEIDVVRPTQKFGPVFKKYCDKIPTVQEHVGSVFAAAEVCAEEDEQPWLKLLLNITNTAATTVCHNEGDRLSMFLEDDGPECMLSQKDGLEHCANETLSRQFHPDFSYNNLLLVSTSNTEGCGDFVKVRTCVVKALEKCEDISTAILVGALFSIIRRVLPCANKPTP